MNDLINLIEIMKLLKYEHELTLNITEQEIELLNIGDVDNEIQRIKHSLEKITIGLHDAHLIAYIKAFLKWEHTTDLTTKKKLYLLHYTCNQMKTELLFLSEKLNENENKIKFLEAENSKLKEELNLSSIIRKNPPICPISSRAFSPTSISSLFRFNETNEKIKKQRQQFSKMKVPCKMNTLYNLVMEYTVRGHYSVAIPLCQQALYEFEKSTGKYCNEYATVLHIMANVYKDIGDYQKSIDLMLEAFKIREKINDLPKSEILKTLNYLSVLYGLLFNWDESAKYCKECIELIKKVFGNSDIRLIKELENMAIICKNDKKMEDAVNHFREAHNICIQNSQQDDALRLTKQMADCYLYLHQYEKALKLYKNVYNVNHQSNVSCIWGIKSPLWKIAEEYENSNIEEPDSTQFNWNAWRNNDKLDEHDLRDILAKMSRIYRQLNMNKAGKFLKEWPKFNILAKNNLGKLYKSSSMVQLNDETLIQDKICQNTLMVGSRRRRLSENIRDKCSINKLKQSNAKSDDDIIIYDSWTKYFVGFPVNSQK